MTRLSDQLTVLAIMSPAQLRAEWRRVYRTSPPALSADLLARGIAYRLQEKRYGGLAAQAERELLYIAANSTTTVPVPRPDISLRAGTKLVRRDLCGIGDRRRLPVQGATPLLAHRHRTRDHGRGLVGTTLLRSD